MSESLLCRLWISLRWLCIQLKGLLVSLFGLDSQHVFLPGFLHPRWSWASEGHPVLHLGSPWLTKVDVSEHFWCHFFPWLPENTAWPQPSLLTAYSKALFGSRSKETYSYPQFPTLDLLLEYAFSLLHIDTPGHWTMNLRTKSICSDTKWFQGPVQHKVLGVIP